MEGDDGQHGSIVGNGRPDPVVPEQTHQAGTKRCAVDTDCHQHGGLHSRACGNSF